MEATIEEYSSGWYGVCIDLTDKDVEELIIKLQSMRKNTEADHFHMRIIDSDVSQKGIADIQFTNVDAIDLPNLEIC